MSRDPYYNQNYGEAYGAILFNPIASQYFTNSDGTPNYSMMNNYIGARENGISNAEIFSKEGQKNYLGNQNPTAKYGSKSSEAFTNISPAIDKAIGLGAYALKDTAKQATDAATKTDWGGILSGAGDVMSGIGALGSVGLGIYSAIENKKQMEEQLKLARENFNFQKGLANRNLVNQAKAYNQEVAARSALAAAYDRSNPNAQANYTNKWSVSEAEIK